MRTQEDVNKNIKSMEGRIKRLAKKQGITSTELETKHQVKFQKQARFMGGGTYQWCDCYSTDTRELFLLGVLVSEGLKLNNNYDG